MLKFIHIFSEYDTGTAKVTPVKEETRLEFNEKLSDINEISEVEEYKCVLHVNEKGVAQDFVSSQEFLYFSLYLTELSHENIVLISDITILNSIQPYLSYMSNNQYSFKMGNKSLYIYYIPIDALPMSTIIDQVNNIMIPTLFRANDELSIKNKKLMSTHTYDKFKDFVDMYVMDSKDISFDIETNAHNKYSKTIEIVGFSVAVGDNGIYVCKESLDCKMSNEDWNNTLILIKSILDNHNVIVHNCMYEIPVLVNDWNYEIKNFDDTMIKSRIILGANTGASLKFQCQSNLNYPDWDSDLGIYTESIDKIVTNISPTPSGGGSEYFDELTVNGFKSVLSKLNDISDLELNKKHLSLKHYMISLESLITRYYTDDSERNNIFDKISSLLVLLVNNKFTGLISYGLIPYKIISTYGAMDAIGTYDLNNYLDKKLDKLSDELGVDLSKGYSYLKPQFIVGIWMEMNGLYYDNDVALEVEDWHINSRLNSMRFLMKSDKLSEYLISQNRDNIFKEYIKEDPYRISEFINDKFVVMKSGIKIEGNSRVTTWNRLYDYLIQGSSHDLIPKIDILVRDKLSEIIDTSDYDELKSYFNPNSTSPSTIKLFSDIWLTDEVRVAGFLFYFDIYIDNNDTSNFNDSEKRLENLFVDYKKWKHSNIDSKIDEDDSNSDSYEYHEDFLSLGENITQRSVFILAKNIFDIEYSNIKNSDLVKSIRKYLSEELESIKEDVVIELYNRFMFTGIDIDDTYTWSDELRILYNFRIVKKCSKILTTYIDGNKVGRGQVYKVLTKELNDKDVMLAKRGKTYYEVDGKLSADESFIMQPSYAVCATETFRWRAGLHTLPSSSSVMNIFRSRFKGGVIMAPDFSQMEIRAMAGASNCNNMLDAFKRGVDIHLWNASAIWNIPEEEVTSAQRRYAKMSSFSILYGKSPEGFGKDFLHGDIKLANKIYDRFYNAFPEVKDYIDKKHQEVMSRGKVTTPVNLYLSIDPNKIGPEAAMRQSQNYPIQNSGTTMAGNATYKIMEYIKSKDYRSRVILFIHDSIELDIHPDEIIPIGSKVIPLMNKYPLEEFGVPSAADLTVGVSLGQQLEVKEMTNNDDFSYAELIVEGFEKDFSSLIDRLKQTNTFSVIDYEDLEDPSPFVVSRGDLFIPRSVIKPTMGETLNIIKRKLTLKK